MASILTLLQRYALADPAAATGLGQFADPRLQVLYDQLVAGGSVSLVEALKVGAAIEEIDIIDLQAALALVDNRDIRLVYEPLERFAESSPGVRAGPAATGGGLPRST
jgi:hypothetical protein